MCGCPSDRGKPTRQLQRLADDAHGLLVASHDTHVISIATRVLDLEAEPPR